MNVDKLVEVLGIQSYSYDQKLMVEYIEQQIAPIECSYYFDNDNIYITKGNATKYPCVVAHMDTVHKIVEDLTVVDLNGNLTGFNAIKMEQTGIGGDDKVGVFVALQCLEMFDNIKIAFFRDEEVGCHGSYEADVSFFKDCNIVLQCDRRGNADFINNASGVKLSSNEFQDEIAPILKNYGYKFHDGMMTDVMALKELGIKASMANISCGYYNPHSKQEFVNIDDVSNCLDMVIDIIEHIGDRTFNCKYSVPKSYDFVFKNQVFGKHDFNKPYSKSKATATPPDYEFESYRDHSDTPKPYFDDCCDGCGDLAQTKFNNNVQFWLCDKCQHWY